MVNILTIAPTMMKGKLPETFGPDMHITQNRNQLWELAEKLRLAAETAAQNAENQAALNNEQAALNLATYNSRRAYLRNVGIKSQAPAPPPPIPPRSPLSEEEVRIQASKGHSMSFGPVREAFYGPSWAEIYSRTRQAGYDLNDAAVQERLGALLMYYANNDIGLGENKGTTIGGYKGFGNSSFAAMGAGLDSSGPSHLLTSQRDGVPESPTLQRPKSLSKN